MKSFHVYLYGPNCGAIASSFEEASHRLQQIPRLCFEPDGSFVLAKTGGEELVYGMLYDAAYQLQYVELRGSCHRETWRDLVTAIRGNAAHDLAVMSLPQRQLQDLQCFEESAFC